MHSDGILAGSLVELFETAAIRHRDLPALRLLTAMDAAHADVEMSFAELASGVFALADHYRSISADTGARIALIVSNTADGQIALWAAEIAGTALPINPLLPETQIAALLANANAAILVVESETVRAALGALVPTGCRVITLNDATAVIAQAPRSAVASDKVRADAHPDRLAAIYLTGGTTGLPKLVRHLERNQLAAASSCAGSVDMRRGDVILNPLPLFHVAGAICVSLAAIITGACQLLPTRMGGRSPGFRENFWNMVDLHKVSVIAGVPTILAGVTADLPERKPPSLRVILTGGSSLPVAIEQVLDDRWQMPVQIIYGMTETAGIIAARRAGTVFPPGWLGPAVDGTELRVVSDQRDSRSILDPLARGHVLAKGVTIGPGYTVAELNKDLFTADGWLITGDLGMLDRDGNLCLSGRAKDIIIRGGHNIDASTIEEAAMCSADVEAAAAVPAPDSYAGEVPYLYVTAKPGCLIDPNALREMLKGRLEGPAVPKHVEVLGQLPLTGAGKVYKPALVMLATRKVLQVALQARAIPDDCWTIEERAGRLVVTTDAGCRDMVETVLDTMSLELG